MIQVSKVGHGVAERSATLIQQAWRLCSTQKISTQSDWIFVLVLERNTWAGARAELLARQVVRALAAGTRIVLVHRAREDLEARVEDLAEEG